MQYLNKSIGLIGGNLASQALAVVIDAGVLPKNGKIIVSSSKNGDVSLTRVDELADAELTRKLRQTGALPRDDKFIVSSKSGRRPTVSTVLSDILADNE